MKLFRASAPAKLILFGEHAVVYGQPAIAIPISDVRASAEIQIDHSLTEPRIRAEDFNIEYSLGKGDPPAEIKHIVEAINFVADQTKLSYPPQGWRLVISSQIPIARGLGSSAAISVILIKVLFKLSLTKLSENTLLKLSYQLEKYHHERPSGIDNTVISLEKPILFQKERKIEPINPKRFYFVIGDTGIIKKTSKVVAEVAERYSRNRELYQILFQNIGKISLEGLEALQTGNGKKLGELMNTNQTLLAEIGVSCPELDKLIRVARENGAWGAKLCGAGKGGCMVALTKNWQQARYIAAALTEAGAVNSFVTALKDE